MTEAKLATFTGLVQRHNCPKRRIRRLMASSTNFWCNGARKCLKTGNSFVDVVWSRFRYCIFFCLVLRDAYTCWHWSIWQKWNITRQSCFHVFKKGLDGAVAAKGSARMLLSRLFTYNSSFVMLIWRFASKKERPQPHASSLPCIARGRYLHRLQVRTRQIYGLQS